MAELVDALIEELGIVVKGDIESPNKANTGSNPVLTTMKTVTN